MENNDNKRKLYDALSKDYDMGSFEQFSTDIQDETKRKKLYDATSKDYDFGDYDKFSEQLGFGKQSEAAPVATESTAEEESPLTEEQKQEFAEGIGSMQRRVDAGMKDFNQRVDNIMQYGVGLDYGQTKKGKQVLNPTTGKLEQTYLTPTGESTTDKAAADRATFQFRQRTADMTVGGQLRNAEKQRAEIIARMNVLAKELDEKNDSFLRRLASASSVTGGLTYNDDLIKARTQDGEYAKLHAALTQVDERIATLKDERDRQAGKDVGFWRGFGKVVSNPATWDMGYSDLTAASAMLQHGKNDTEGEAKADEMMMQQTYENQQVQSAYGGNAGFLNRAGIMFGHMPAFAIDFAVTLGGYSGLNFFGKAAAKGATKAIGKEVVEEMAKEGFKSYVKKNGLKGFGNEAANWTVKALGTTADDLLVRAPLMTNTVQGQKVAADVIDRKLGDVVVDENGNYDFSNDKSWGSAIWQGEANAVIENFSEMFGTHIDDVVSLGKIADVLGAKRISGMLSKANNSSFGQVLDTTKKQFEKLGVSDYLGEVTEEYYGQLWRTMLNLDDAYQQNADGTRTNLLATGQFHGDIWGGMALSMGLMGAGRYGISAANYGSMKHQVNVADRRANQTLSPEVWEPLRTVIDNTSNEDIGVLAERIINDSSFTEPERDAVMGYMERSLNLRGYNLGNLAKQRGSEANADEEELNQSYMDGYNASTPQEMNNARNMYEYQRERVSDLLSEETLAEFENNPVESLANLNNDSLWDSPWTDEEKRVMTDYLNAKMVYDGMLEGVRNSIDEQIAASDAMIDGRVNKATGMIQPATMKVDDRRVYIVSGSLSLNEDGTIDHSNSDESIIIRDAETGALEFSDPASVFTMDAPIDAMAEKEAMRVQIRESQAQEAADKIDGVLSFTPGDVYSISDGQGGVQQISIVGDAMDEQGVPLEGQVVVQIGEQQTVMPREEIQALSEAASLESLNAFEQERAAERQQAQEAALEASRPQYRLNDEVSLMVDGVPVRGSITAEADADGRIEVFSEEPINGNKVNLFTREELDALSLSENNGETTENDRILTENDKIVEGSSVEVQPSVSALSRIPLDEQGQPMYEQTDADTAWDAIVEQTEGDEDTALSVAESMLADKEAALKKAEKAKPKSGVSIAEKIAAEKERKEVVRQAQAEVDIWKQIVNVSAQRKEAARKDQEAKLREEQAKLTEQAIIDEKKRKEEEAAKAAAQAEVGTNNVAPSIREKWTSATKVDGAASEYVLPNGEKVSGHYVLVESGAASASHDAANAFAKTEGFPVDENGQSVNDRDYERDADAQNITRQIAANYDSRAVQTPVVVSQDGVVLSGNGRTMAGELAAAGNTDAAYIEHIGKYAGQYGFTPEQVASMQHPRVVFVPDDAMPYTAETFAKFNQQEMKGQSKTEQAVKFGKVVDDATFNRIVRKINAYDTLGDFYADTTATAEAIKELQKAGVLVPAQITEMFDGDSLSARGREVLENMLIGKAFESNPDAVRQITAYKSVRQSIISALAEISNNIMLGSEYSLESELSQAIALVYAARQSGIKQGEAASSFARQGNLFQLDEGATIADYQNATVMMLADILNDNRSTRLKKTLSLYNNQAADSANGQMDLFSGSVESKQDIINQVNQLLNNGTEAEQQSALDEAAERRKEEASVQQNGDAGTSDAGSRQTDALAATEEVALSERVKVQDNDWEEGDDKHPTYKRTVVIDGVHKATQVDAPDSKGYYTGSHYEYDGKRFGDVQEVISYIDGKMQTVEEKVAQAEAETDTHPTDAQKEAGNYKKGHVKIDDFNVTIENPKGSERSGTDASGKPWSVTMNNTYGYIRGTEGVDGDHIDVFLSDTPSEGDVFVVDQVKADGSFDEHKVMYGFPSVEAAREAYLANYSPGWKGLGNITHVSREEFKKWVDSSHRKTKPFAEYKSVKPFSESDHIVQEREMVDEHKPKAESTDGYTVERRFHKKNGTYINAVKFTENMPREAFLELKKRVKDFGGYYSSFGKGGFIFGNEEDAHKFAKAVLDKSGEQLDDAAPISLQDVKEASGVQETVADSANNAPTSDDNHKLVTNERYEELKKRMREKLGGQLNVGIDPEILTIGIEMALYHIEGGARKFADYAKGMIADMGDAIRPYLKAFYNGARDLPEVTELGYASEMSPYDEVNRFDVANFDKSTSDAMATAQQVINEQVVKSQEEEVKAEVKKQRNDKRKSSPTKEQDALKGRVVLNDGRAVTILYVVSRGEQTDNAQFTEGLIERYYANHKGDIIDFTPEMVDMEATEALKNGSNDSKSNKKTVTSQKETGDLFGNLFGEVTNNDENDTEGTGSLERGSGKDGQVGSVSSDGTGVLGTRSVGRSDDSNAGGSSEAEQRVPDAAGTDVSRQRSSGRTESRDNSGHQEPAASNDRGRSKRTGNDEAGRSDVAADSTGSDSTEKETPKDSRRNPKRVRSVKPEPKFEHNYRYPENASEIDNLTPAKRLDANVEALTVLRNVLVEGRQATEAERETLGRFRGWGGIPGIERSYSTYQLRQTNNLSLQKLADIIDELDPNGKRGILEAIRQAALTSYYTPTAIARAMNRFVSLAGFKGGSMLDPSMGSGVFEGTMEKAIQQRTHINGVELDWLTGQIAKHLYPDGNVRIDGYQNTQISPNSQDVVMSNIPFGSISVTDSSWKNDGTPVKKAAQGKIHNYFAVKMLEHTRPGGLCVIMTSNAILDTASNQIIRDHILDTAEVLGVVRLPDNTFKGAGTSVVTDVLFLRKYKDASDRNTTMADERYQKQVREPMLRIAEQKVGDVNVKLNGYFEANPSMMIGTVKAGGQYRKDEFGLGSTLSTNEIAEAMDKLIVKSIVGKRKGKLFDTTLTTREVHEAVRESYVGQGNYVSNGNIVEQNGKIGIVSMRKNKYGDSSSMFEEIPSLAKQADRVRAMIKLRTAMKERIAKEIGGEDDTVIDELRKRLQEAYNAFVGKYGKLNDRANNFLTEDIDGYSLRALETVDEKGNVTGLSDLFTKNTIKSKLNLVDAQSPQDAISLSLAEYGEIRPSYMEAVLGEGWEEMCGDAVFELPYHPDWYVTNDDYLSGDVKSKLKEAREAAADDKRFERNVAALEAVQPKTIPFDQISIRMGARWVPTDVYTQFLYEIFGIPNYRHNKNGVTYSPEADQFVVNISSSDVGGAAEQWKTARRSASEVFEAALTDKTLTVYDTYEENGKEVKVLNKEQTELVNNKIQDLRTEFEDWLPKDSERVAMLQETYNERFNRNVLRKFDGSHLNVPGLMGKELRPHQKDAVWMLVNNRGGIVDHIVGAGKTLVMQSAIMEMRRMGIAKKPMIVALKATVAQIAKEFREAYPAARILAPTEKDFATDRRKKFLANIAMNDYDCVILSHEQYCQLPHTEEIETGVINEQLAQLDSAISFLYGQDDKTNLSKKQIKGLEKRKANLEAKLQKLLDRKVDREFTFENLGVDYLFVDECQAFKSLPYVTSYQNVAGLADAKGSQKAISLLNGVRYLQQYHQGDRGTVFLSGTTITNSLVEIYNLMQYLRPQEMQRMGLTTFDAWAGQFAVRSSELEYGVTNELKEKNRFRNFDNVPELAKMYAEIADVRNDMNLQLPKPKPRMQIVTVPASDALKEINREVINMVQRKDGSYFGKITNDRSPFGLLASGISTKAAISTKLIDPELDDEGGKIFYVCENVKKVYDKFAEQKGTQLIFCDTGTPGKGKEYDAYTDIINRLVNEYGIPRNEIVDIHVANTDDKRKALFKQVNEGKVRILIGGTKNMGTGVNVQKRIVAMHHVDVPWTPADREQREGRGVRQGNEIARDFNGNHVDIFFYATEGSLDMYKYQLQDTKGKMFAAFKGGTVGDRNFDEGNADEEGGFDPAEIVALLSGNPVIFEKSKQDKKVEKLRRAKRAWESDWQRRKFNYDSLLQQKEKYERLLMMNKRDVSALDRGGFKPDENGVYPSEVTVHDLSTYDTKQTFDKPKEAGTYIIGLLKKGKSVSLSGFGMRASVVVEEIDGISSDVFIIGKRMVELNAPSGIKYSVQLSEDETNAGLSFRSVLQRVFSNRKTYETKLEEVNNRLNGANPGENVYPKQAELDEAIAEKERLDAEYKLLSDEKDDKKPTEEGNEVLHRDAGDLHFSDRRRTKKEIAYAEREHERMRKRVQKLSELLHVDIEVIEDRSVLEGKKQRAKGFFDTRTGKITIVLPNHTSAFDVEKTILHEAVAHKGLRALFGEHFTTFLDNVYANADEEIRKEIAAKAAKYGWDFRTATEEYLAELAERTDFDYGKSSWWSKIKHLFMQMLHKIGFEGFDMKSERLTDNELRYLLWRSYENLKDPNSRRSILGTAKDVAKQASLEVGNYSKNDAAVAASSTPRKEKKKVLSFSDRNDTFIPNDEYTSNFIKQEFGVETLTKEQLDALAKYGGLSFRIHNQPMAAEKRAVSTPAMTGWRSRVDIPLYRKGDVYVTDELAAETLRDIIGADEFPTTSIEEVLPKLIRSGNRVAIVDDYQQVVDSGIRYRMDTDPIERVSVRQAYEKEIASSLYQFQEAMQDSMLGLKVLMEKVLKANGKKEAADFENAYMAENAMSSKSRAETESYANLVMKPLLMEISQLEKRGASREMITEYLMAKHGLERNKVMAEREAEKAYNEYAAAHPNGGKTLQDFINSYRQRDFAGLTALTGEDDVAFAESVAQQMVDDFEASYPTDALWQRVNDATKATLSKMYESGILDKESYEQIRDMYEFYIPLRGWDEKTADEVYGYLTDKNGAMRGSILKKAEGRTSKADDPIATIAAMAESGITQGNRNLMKQKFLNFVLNNPSDAVSVSSLWLKHNEVTDEWEPLFADLDKNDSAAEVERKVKDFEERMEAFAQAEPDKYKHGKDAVHIPYVVKRHDLKEHQVLVKRAGRTYVLTINGNPRAAQAINGLTNPNVEMEGTIGNILKAGEFVNRQMSAFYTTRNPNFVASNFIRDALYGNSMVWVKESPNYALRFHKNFGKVNPARIKMLLSKYRNGTLDMGNRLENSFHQFMMNGGETGYTITRDVEAQKKAIKEELAKERQTIPVKKALSYLSTRFDDLNRSVENCARFAAFLTSREMGRSVERSIYDAKEISVNFNKKGAGSKFLGATGQTKVGDISAFVSGGGRLGYVFWNAAIQGTTNFVKNAKAHPVKAFSLMASAYLLGAILPMLGGDGDGDDEKNYYNLPDYTRRSNVCFRIGDKWITIPLPVELRAMYGLGELSTSVISGNEPYSDGEVARKIAEQLSQMMPLDLMEGGGNLSALIPSSVKPVAEVFSNKDWTGLPIYKDSPYNKNMPEWTKAYSRTNRFLVELSEWSNRASGGDDFKKGWADWNPAVVEHLLEGVFGGVTTTINQMAKTAETITGERDFDWRNIPIASRVIKNADERTQMRNVNNQYFKCKDEYEETGRLLRKYEGAADMGLMEYAEKADFLYNSKAYARYEVMDEYIKEISDLQEELKELEGDQRKMIEAVQNGLKNEMLEALRALDEASE